MTTIEENQVSDEDVVAQVGGHAHPSDKTYVLIAVILATFTAIEISLYYLEDRIGSFAAPSLIFLSFCKFMLVVLFFMHLKFEKPILRKVFFACMGLATACYIGYLLAMGGIFWTSEKPFVP